MKKPDLKKTNCPNCGGTVRTGMVNDYQARPRTWGTIAGGKGIDLSYVADFCDACGGKEVRAVASPEAQAEHEMAMMQYEAWLSWVASLPKTIDLPWEYQGKSGVDILTINQGTLSIEDAHGNYLFPLPGLPVEDLAGWLKNKSAGISGD